VPKSVIEAIQLGKWDFEPKDVEGQQFDSTEAMPGTREKVAILAERAESGLPLWHPADRRTYEP
jgi:hypothetical protein